MIGQRWGSSWTAILCIVGILGVLVFGLVAPLVDRNLIGAGLAAALLAAAVFLALAIVTGLRLWRRLQDRHASSRR